eukprot:1671663-Rhodomonas_salina.1
MHTHVQVCTGKCTRACTPRRASRTLSRPPRSTSPPCCQCGRTCAPAPRTPPHTPPSVRSRAGLSR